MKKNIYNLLNLLQEGVEWKVNPDKTVNMTINDKRDDKSNLAGKFAVDNRRYSTKDNMLNGDHSSKKLSTIQDNYELNNTLYGDKGFYITLYKLLQQYEKTGATKLPNSTVSTNIFDSAIKKSKANISKNSYVISSIKAFKDKVIAHADIEDILKLIRVKLQDHSLSKSVAIETHDRVINDKPDKNGLILRYYSAKIPNTQVKLISLYKFNDFNFNEVLKHAQFKQTDATQALLGTGSNTGFTNATIDGNKIPVLKNGKSDIKVFFNGDKRFPSANKFFNMTALHTKNIFKSINFKPDYILSIPSSSDYNKYYCQKLAGVLACNYLDDFFVKDYTDVKLKVPSTGKFITFDKNHLRDAKQALMEFGYNDDHMVMGTLFDFVKKVQNFMIAQKIAKPIKDFVFKNKEIFDSIAIKKSDRTKCNINEIYHLILSYTYKYLIYKSARKKNKDMLEFSIYSKYIQNSKLKVLPDKDGYDYNYIISHFIVPLLTRREIKPQFLQALKDTYTAMQSLTDELKNGGFSLSSLGDDKVMLTYVQKRMRPFVSNLYFVANKYLTEADENGLTQCQKDFQNKKFVIFDEDFNSGASMRLCCEAFLEKQSDSFNQNNIICLTNMFSLGGN